MRKFLPAYPLDISVKYTFECAWPSLKELISLLLRAIFF